MKKFYLHFQPFMQRLTPFAAGAPHRPSRSPSSFLFLLPPLLLPPTSFLRLPNLLPPPHLSHPTDGNPTNPPQARLLSAMSPRSAQPASNHPAETIRPTQPLPRSVFFAFFFLFFIRRTLTRTSVPLPFSTTHFLVLSPSLPPSHPPTRSLVLTP